MHAEPILRVERDLAYQPKRVAYLIMAGGQGSRLWPLSHAARPKQFADVLGVGRSMLQLTLARLPNDVPMDRVFINVAPDCVALVREQAPQVPPENIIVVPQNRDTLPTLGYAAVFIGRRFADATLVVMASDNVVGDIAALHVAFKTMVTAAQSGPNIVSLGVQPSFASTSYGYMRRGAAASFGDDCCFGDGYVEKPDLATAQSLIADGRYDWNSGMFAWDIATFLQACDALAPAHGEVFAELAQVPCDDRERIHALFEKLPVIALDHGLLEKIGDRIDGPRHVFVTGRFAWDDVGTLGAVEKYIDRDAWGNGARGAVDLCRASGTVALCDARYRLNVCDIADLVIVVNERGDVLVADRCRVSEVGNMNKMPLATGYFGPDMPAGDNADSAGNRVVGLGRFYQSRECRLQNNGPGVVSFLGVDRVEVVLESDTVTVRPYLPRATSVAHHAFANVSLSETAHDVAGALAAQLVGDLRGLLQSHLYPAVVFSAGATPVVVYQLLATTYRNALPWHRVRLMQMDEYVGLEANDPRAFRTFLRHALVSRLHMQAHYLRGTENDEDMQRYEQFIDDTGGLQLVLHGIGANGHLGFNEPGAKHACGSSRVALAARTRADCAAVFGGNGPTHGVTLGLRVLNAAAQVRVAATGKAKRSALAQGLGHAPSESSPLSSLQHHADCRWFVDADACPWIRP